MSSTSTDFLTRKLLRAQQRDLDPEERRVLESIERGEPIARDAADAADEATTFGQRLSDKVAAVGGSWSFIIAFSLVLLGWMLLNTDVLSRFGLAFDPYPYIFLNLMLSTLAAIQAPIIMMSQNRAAARDRTAAALDFQVNLRAELEIFRIHAKIDHAVMQRFDEVISSNAELVNELRAIREELAKGTVSTPKDS